MRLLELLELLELLGSIAAASTAVLVTTLVMGVGWYPVLGGTLALHRRGRSRPALALSRLLLRIPRRWERHAGAWLMATVRADRGETDAAVEATHLMLQSHVWESHLWRAAGNATNLLVNAGLYRESVLLPRRWSARARRAARLRDPVQYAVAQVNRAEALHNLGRDDAALRLLARVEAPARRHALARDGRHCLRAWIHAHRGDVEHAAADLAEIGNSILERHYAPELHYTRAKLALARGRHAQARDQAERGLSRAVRAASQRNGLFLLAEIAAAAGEPEKAVALFERGIGHRYRAQGGASLALYAELLGRHGRDQETARVEELMLARDPQSAAAARIRTRLRSHSETRDEGSDRTGDRVVAEPLDRLRS